MLISERPNVNPTGIRNNSLDIDPSILLSSSPASEDGDVEDVSPEDFLDTALVHQSQF